MLRNLGKQNPVVASALLKCFSASKALTEDKKECIGRMAYQSR